MFSIYKVRYMCECINVINNVCMNVEYKLMFIRIDTNLFFELPC